MIIYVGIFHDWVRGNLHVLIWVIIGGDHGTKCFPKVRKITVLFVGSQAFTSLILPLGIITKVDTNVFTQTIEYIQRGRTIVVQAAAKCIFEISGGIKLFSMTIVSYYFPRLGDLKRFTRPFPDPNQHPTRFIFIRIQLVQFLVIIINERDWLHQVVHLLLSTLATQASNSFQTGLI